MKALTPLADGSPSIQFLPQFFDAGTFNLIVNSFQIEPCIGADFKADRAEQQGPQ